MTADCDHINHRLRIPGQDRFFVRLQPFIVGGIFDQSVFNNLTQAGYILLTGQCFQRLCTGIHQFWLMKSPHHVLIGSEINTCFSSDAAVHLCQKACGNLDKTNASQISCRCKACQITDNTAAKRHQHIFTFKFILNQKFIKILNCCQRFALFTGRKNKMTGSCTMLFYNMLYLFKVKVCHMAVCYDTHLSVFDHQIIQRFTKRIKIL